MRTAKRSPAAAGRVALVASMLVGTALVASCGIPLDNKPRAIAPSKALPAESNSVSPDGVTQAWMYAVQDDRLVAKQADVSSTDPTSVLTALISGPGVSDEANSIINQIPPGTTLLGFDTNGSAATLNLSQEFGNLVGIGGTQATAQIVLTATELEGIEAVSFQVQGRPVLVVSPTSGDSETVGACDYVGLLATAEELQTTSLDRETVRHLNQRRNVLNRTCES
jgi:hypothetical protein